MIRMPVEHGHVELAGEGTPRSPALVGEPSKVRQRVTDLFRIKCEPFWDGRAVDFEHELLTKKKKGCSTSKDFTRTSELGTELP